MADSRHVEKQQFAIAISATFQSIGMKSSDMQK